MKTTNSINIPDSTYFTMSDVEPTHDEESDTLTLFNGEGSRRSWGRPSVTSTVIINSPLIVAVHVGFSHKHRGGQGWHYWRPSSAGVWEKVTWGQLPDSERKKVLDRTDRAPRWAKSPGKLKSEYKRGASKAKTAYKIVKVDANGNFLSLYDDSPWEIDAERCEKARDDHRGGFYAYSNREDLMEALRRGRLVPERCLTGVTELAILKVRLRGRMIRYTSMVGTKIAATYLKPLEVQSRLQRSETDEKSEWSSAVAR